MNALLASGEVPGLFEGDDWSSLMQQCREAAAARNAMLDSPEELYAAFVAQVQRNLHVVFTMNPAGSDMAGRSATSPALFNRCVVDWFGTWSTHALAQVAEEFTRTVDLNSSEYASPSDALVLVADILPRVNAPAPAPSLGLFGESKQAPLVEGGSDGTLSFHEAVVSSLVLFHRSTLATIAARAQAATAAVGSGAGEEGGSHGSGRTFLSPRDYLDFIQHFTHVYGEKRVQVEEQQLHLNVGLEKLRNTAEQVSSLQSSLSLKKQQLEEKDVEANNKLQSMVVDQQEAERLLTKVNALNVTLSARNVEVEERRAVAEGELAKAEPALLEAQSSVKGIRKKHLDELRNLGNPPPAVKLTLEAVMLMIGEADAGADISWSSIRRAIRKDTFIAGWLGFLCSSVHIRCPFSIHLLTASHNRCGELQDLATERTGERYHPAEVHPGQLPVLQPGEGEQVLQSLWAPVLLDPVPGDVQPDPAAGAASA
jgi:dynein heavy chain 1